MPKTQMQPSFAAGELSPSLWARNDLAKFHVGAKLLRNFFVMAHGGAANRPGTSFVGRVKDSGHAVRLIPFSFNTQQTYVLEFGQYYMRVIMDGGQVLEPSITIGTATKAAPVQITTNKNHGFSIGDEVFISGISGMTMLNNGRFLVTSIPSVTTMTLATLDGNPVDATSWTAYAGGGQISRIYTLTTPYAANDLAGLKVTQSADVMTICHTSYVPKDLTRTGHAAWTLTDITFQPQIGTPSSLTGSCSKTGSWHFGYVVTAIQDSPSEEGLPTNAVKFTGDQLNQNTGVQNTLSWPAVSCDRYKIYKARPVYNSDPVTGCMYGYIGSTTGTSFVDVNIDPDFTKGPPQWKNPFSNANNPAVAEYYEQRRVFAASSSHPHTLWFSQPASYYNMDTSTPSQASDAITATIAARQVNAIKFLMPMNHLIALTSSGAWKISAGSTAEAISPSNIVVKPQVYNGCADIPPIIVGNDILYIQNKGSMVRDLSYNFYADVYTGTDMSIMATHLFFGYSIVDWTYAEEPFKLVWAIRNDGTLLSFTYLKEQDVYAWARHDTQGSFKSVTSISEGQENSVYFVVQRTIPGVNGGRPVQYIERLASRNFLTNGRPDVTQAWFIDCGLQYQGEAIKTVSGLSHLEGAKVSILADGNVVPQQDVTNGGITLTHPAKTITVGLPYQSQLQTLGLDLPVANGTSQGKRKKISAVTVRVESSRGLKIGHTASSLIEIKERSSQPYGAAIPLMTKDERVVLDPLWSVDEGVFIQQDDPLPATILGVIPEFSMGDTL